MKINLTSQLPYLFLLFLSLNFVSAITLDELISSYNFSYADENINVTNITQIGIDTDNNSLYDYLIIQITAKNTEGNYNIIGDISQNSQATANNQSYLMAGTNVLTLTYNPKKLTGGFYNLSLVISENYFTHFRNSYTFYFNSTEYEQPDTEATIINHAFQDIDSDAKYELLQIGVNIIVPSDGLYSITAYIMGNASVVLSSKNYSLSAGTNQIQLTFNTSDLIRFTYGNLYKVIISKDESYEFLQDYTIPFEDLDPEKAIFTGFNDEKIDLNGNNLIDYLKLSIGIYAPAEDDYNLELILLDGNDAFYDKINVISHLAIGENIIDIPINAIYTAKPEAPLKISSIALVQNNKTTDSLINPYATSYFNFADFEPPEMPDLTFVSFSANQNQLQATIKNTGITAYAIPIQYFDQDFNILHEESILGMQKNEENSISINITNTTAVIYAFIDYDNAIEEQNESNNMFMLELNATTIISIYLIHGWNLVSVPLLLKNSTLPAPMASIEGNYNSVFAFNAQEKTWDSFDPAKPEFLNTLLTIDTMKGYWISMQVNDTLQLEGNLPQKTAIPLYAGWNLIGYPSQKIQNISVVFKDINYYSVFMYNATGERLWLMYDASATIFLRTLYQMYPFFGYWVRAPANGTLVIS